MSRLAQQKLGAARSGDGGVTAKPRQGDQGVLTFTALEVNAKKLKHAESRDKLATSSSGG
jgi:hypothetical protein